MLLLIVGAVIYTRKKNSTALEQIRAAAPPLANVVHNRAFADPNQQLPYGGVEVGHAHDDADANNVQPTEVIYLEADPNRASIYDAGRLAGSAAHALRDQRRASQMLDPAALGDATYEEIGEDTAFGTGSMYEGFDSSADADDGELDC